MKNHIKALIYIGILFLSLFLITGCSSNKFVIDNNDAAIKEGIESFINRGRTDEVEVSIKNEYIIDNKKIVSFIINGSNLGYSEMEIKDDGGKLKIGATGHGTNFIRNRIITTNENKHLVIIGGKYNKDVKYIEVLFENKKYIFDVEEEPYFIQSYIVPKDSTSNFGTKVRFYDKKNNDITNDIKLDI